MSEWRRSLFCVLIVVDLVFVARYIAIGWWDWATCYVVLAAMCVAAIHRLPERSEP